MSKGTDRNEFIGAEPHEDEGEGEGRYAELAGDDEEVAHAMFRDILDCFLDADGVVDDTTLVLDSVVRFTATVTQMASYELAGMARELDESPEAAAAALLREAHRAFIDYLTDATMFAGTGKILGEPELALKLDRKFRRSLV